MKSFHSFITERRAKNFGTKGGEGGPGPSEAKRAASKAKTSRPTVNPGKSLTIDQILRAGRPKGAAAAVGTDEVGVYIGSDKDAIKKAIDQERVGKQATHPVDAETTRQSGREKTGGRVTGEREVGAQKPRSRFVKGQGYTIPTKGKPATRIPGGTGTSSGSLSRGTLTFSGDAKYKRLLRRLTTDVKPLPSGTGVRKEFKPEIKTEPTSKPRVVRGADTLAKPPKPPKPTTYRNLGLGPETAGRSLDVKRVRASNPVRASRPQTYSNLGLGQERAGQRVVNRPVKIRVKPPIELLKPPGTSSTAVADKVVKKMQDAAKKKSASNVRTLGRIGTGLGAVSAGLEAQGEYMRRKDLGQDTSTAVKGAATRTSGGIGGAAIGGKLGAKFGSVFGPKGALLGGTAGSIYGYMVGADKATQAFDNISKGGSKGFAKGFAKGLVDFASFRKKASSAK